MAAPDASPEGGFGVPEGGFGVPEGGFGVYVHWPFCAAKCPYCDFNSHVRRSVEQERWRQALVRELTSLRVRTGPARAGSLFFGGGTPSLMEPATVGAVIDAVSALWGFTDDPEISLEANPTSAEAQRFAGFRAAGVNRVSVGVQSLRDTDLKALGRLHSAAEAKAAIGLARETFPRLSFDLIYARPGQTAAAWETELREAIALAADHLSLYQLTIEPGTAFFDLHARGALRVPDEDVAADLYDVTQRVCAAAGLNAYEVSNHAAPGAQSRHNLVYWRYGDYVGAGPGAHGRLGGPDGRRATATIRAPEAWLAAVEARGDGLETDDLITQEAQGAECLLMGLRLSEGVSLNRYAALAGKPLDPARIAALEADGLVSLAQGRLLATSAGRRVLNGVLAALLT